MSTQVSTGAASDRLDHAAERLGERVSDAVETIGSRAEGVGDHDLVQDVRDLAGRLADEADDLAGGLEAADARDRARISGAVALLAILVLVSILVIRQRRVAVRSTRSDRTRKENDS